MMNLVSQWDLYKRWNKCLSVTYSKKFITYTNHFAHFVTFLFGLCLSYYLEQQVLTNRIDLY